MKLHAPKRHLIKSHLCNAAVIKAWIKTDSERGLSRAVSYIRSLALNGHNPTDSQDMEGSQVPTKSIAETNEKAPTVFERITSWGASLLSKSDPGDSGANNKRHRGSPGANVRSKMQSEKYAKQANVDSRGASSSGGRHYDQNQPHQVFAGVGMTSRLIYLHSASNGAKINTTHVQRRDTAIQGDAQGKYLDSFASSRERNENESEPIGPLPNIELEVAPDLKTFQLVASGK